MTEENSAHVDYYTRRKIFVDGQIERLRARKSELTYKDFQEVDMLNWTKAKGIQHFMNAFKPGPNILDLGAGLGGPCRLLFAEYNIHPIGLEYGADNVELGNSISRELNMPEFIIQGDATEPMDYENLDAVTVFGVISQIPPVGQQLMIANIFKILKPGGLVFFEEPVLTVATAQLPAEKSESFEDNTHLKSVFQWSEMRDIITGSGLEIVEDTDVSVESSEGCWDRAELGSAPFLEAEAGTLSAIDQEFHNKFGIHQPRIMSQLCHLTVDEIKNRWPLTSKHSPPEYWVHGLPHEDIKFARIIAKKP